MAFGQKPIVYEIKLPLYNVQLWKWSFGCRVKHSIYLISGYCSWTLHYPKCLWWNILPSLWWNVLPSLLDYPLFPPNLKLFRNCGQHIFLDLLTFSFFNQKELSDVHTLTKREAFASTPLSTLMYTKCSGAFYCRAALHCGGLLWASCTQVCRFAPTVRCFQSNFDMKCILLSQVKSKAKQIFFDVAAHEQMQRSLNVLKQCH